MIRLLQCHVILIDIYLDLLADNNVLNNNGCICVCGFIGCGDRYVCVSEFIGGCVTYDSSGNNLGLSESSFFDMFIICKVCLN